MKGLHSTCIIGGLFALLGAEPGALADTTCNTFMTTTPDALFCDDFDRYCTSPPIDPTQPCASGSSKSDGRLRAVWVPYSTNPNGLCGTQFTVEDDNSRLLSSPFGGRYPCQADAQLGQQQVDLIPAIQNRFGSQYSTMIGTDAVPLVVSFDLNGGNCNTTTNCNVHIQYDIGYLEMGLDNDKGAQIDWVRVGVDDGAGCIDCYHMCPGPNFGPHIPWPTICQSYTARADAPACPPAQTNLRHAIACGVNALLDNNPCHCDIPSDQVPNISRLTFYDGLKWRVLGATQVRPPDEITPPVYVRDATYTGDFVLGAKFNIITMTIKSNTVDIEMSTKTPATVDASTPTVRSKVTGILRKYTGPFNKMRGGVGNGCELNSGSYTCAGNVRCIRSGDTRCDGLGFEFGKQANVTFENVSLKGGGPDVQTGACCLENASCTVVTSDQCAGLGGKFNGLLSTCESTVCCHVPFADADGDHDVDMDDYASFQNCYTGSGTGVNGTCRCFDKAAPAGTINEDDFTAFTNCVSGPGAHGPSADVPWSLANTPNCSKCPPPPALAPGCP